MVSLQCSNCGNKLEVVRSDIENYWEGLSKLYDLPPHIVEGLYKLWNPKLTYKFSDFVHEMKIEAGLELAKSA